MTEQRKNGQNIPRGSGAGKEPHVIKIPLRLLIDFFFCRYMTED